MTCDHEAQIRDLLEEREELLADLGEAERTAEHWEGLWTVAIERAETAEAQVTEKAAEIRRLQRGNHPAAGRALRTVEALPDRWEWRHERVTYVGGDECADELRAALAEALTERDAEHEGGGGA